MKCSYLHVQVANLEIVAGLPDIARNFVRLVGTGVTKDLGPVRDMMVLEPYAELIPLNTEPHKLTKLMRGFVSLVDRMHTQGYLHLDLSYFNLLVYEDQPLLADLQTMQTIDKVQRLPFILPNPTFTSDNSGREEMHNQRYCTSTVMGLLDLKYRLTQDRLNNFT